MKLLVRISVLVCAIFGLGMVGPLAWRSEPQAGQPRRAPVIRLEPNRPVSSALNKGATYYALEVQIERTVVVFDDATITVRRDARGGIAAEVIGRSGRALASLSVHRNPGELFAMQLHRPGRDVLLLRGLPELEPTLEWAARQAYALISAGPGPLAWRRDLIVDVSQEARDPLDSMVEIRTNWFPGFAAVARRHADHVESVLESGGATIGRVRWSPGGRVLSWHFPGLTSGALDDASQAEIGGWPFVPDMPWLNVQAFAFHHFHTSLKARSRASAEPRGLLPRVVDLISPTLYAQDGCTGLHWLDGSMYRPCCDDHDRCFEKYGCSSKSWYWPFGQAWQCSACNVAVTFCFVAKTTHPWEY